MASTKDERIAYIAGLMADNTWRPSLRQQLAEQWGVSFRTVRQDACEAGRQVRGVLDRETALGTMDAAVARAEELAAKAAACCDSASDYVAASQAYLRIADLVGKYAGLAGSQKLAFTTPSGDDFPFGVAVDDELPFGFVRNDDPPEGRA